MRGLGVRGGGVEGFGGVGFRIRFGAPFLVLFCDSFGFFYPSLQELQELKDSYSTAFVGPKDHTVYLGIQKPIVLRVLPCNEGVITYYLVGFGVTGKAPGLF